MFHGRLKCSKLSASTGFPYDKAAILRDTTKWTLHFNTYFCCGARHMTRSKFIKLTRNVICTYVGLSVLQRCWRGLHFLEYDAVQIDRYVLTFSECLLPLSLLFFGYPEDGGNKSVRTLVPVCQSTLRHFPIEWILFKILYIIICVIQ